MPIFYIKKMSCRAGIQLERGPSGNLLLQFKIDRLYGRLYIIKLYPIRVFED